jgi:type VI secretion system protein ImpL
VTGDAGAAPIDGVLRTMQQMQQKMAPIGQNVGERPPDANTLREIGDLSNSLKRDAASLPAPLGAVIAAIANGSFSAVRGSGSTAVTGNYEQAVLRECRDLANGRYPFEAKSSTDIPIADFEHLFGPNGVYDMFFKSDLQDRVNRKSSPWTWLVDTSGAPVGSGVPLAKFEAADRIRQTFFRGGSAKVEVQFTVTMDSLDRDAEGFTLEIDGQPIKYRYEAPRAVTMTWPGPKPGQAIAAFAKSGGQPPAFDGPWALFRLLASGQISREADDQYLFTIKAGAREARLRIGAESVRNPFGGYDLLQRFRCE